MAIEDAKANDDWSEVYREITITRKASANFYSPGGNVTNFIYLAKVKDRTITAGDLVLIKIRIDIHLDVPPAPSG